MKKWLLFLAIAIAASILFYLQERAKENFRNGTAPNSRLERAGSFSVADSSGASPKKAKIVQVSGRTPLEVTQNYIAAHHEEWSLQPHHELVPEISRSPLGSTVRYGVFQDGLPIIGMSLTFRLNRSLEILEVENEYRPVTKADLSVPERPLVDIANEATERYPLVSEGNLEDSSAKVLYVSPGETVPQLAVVIPMKQTDGQHGFQMVFRAWDGQLLQRMASRAEF